MKNIFFLLIAVFTISSCNTQKISNTDFDKSIVEKYWKLKTVNGEKIEMAHNQEREVYFMLKNDGILRGFGGCNQFQGSYKITATDNVKFSNILSTMKACAGVNDFLILNILNQANSFKLEKDLLTLSKDGKILASFEAIYF